MTILIAPDKFKGSLSALEVCEAIERGLDERGKPVEVIFHPMADGGDGSLAALKSHLNLEAQNILTIDPLGRAIHAEYYASGNAAFIEVASASGLVLLKEKERNPLKTSTLGTGKMMVDAITKGYQHIYLFLGGSATNDAGMGIATALGYQFLDQTKNILEPVGENLNKVQFIEPSLLTDLQNVKMTLLCDVTNPLHGSDGAAYVYAKQKGADEAQIVYLDNGLKHFGNVLQKQTGIPVAQLSGSGAAGGIGAGLVALFGAKLKSGFDTIAALTGLEEQIRAADWVISGEGKLDRQSLQGKVVDGLAKLCKQHDKPLTLFVGKNELREQDIADLGIKQVYAILAAAKDMEDAMSNGATYLEKMAARFIF